jgi:amino acid adenylation domain-containing protein
MSYRLKNPEGLKMDALADRISNLSPEKREVLAQLMREQGRTAAPHSHPARRADASAPAPLSYAQERLWFLHQLEPGMPHYNLPATIRLTGALDVSALERTVNEVVRRHQILRTTFRNVDGEPAQFIQPPAPSALNVLDLRTSPPSAGGDDAQRVIMDEVSRPFRLDQSPPLRAVLLRLGEEEHVLLLTMHHIIFDGWSLEVLLREMVSLYGELAGGRPSPLAELSLQYADFAAWQRGGTQDGELEEHLAYWRRQLAGNSPPLQLPFSGPRPAVQTFRGARQSRTVPASCQAALKALSQDAGVTLFMTLLAAFKTLLCRYTGETDIRVGTPIANRTHAELENLIGFFVNTLVLRTDLSGNPTFGELLQRVREVSLEAYEHQDLPFEKLVEALQPERDLSRTPLFQVMFTLQGAPAEHVPSGLRFRLLEPPSGVAKFDLTLEVTETAEGLKSTLEYNTDLFEAGAVGRMLDQYQVILYGIAAAAGSAQHLSDLPLLTAQERHQLLVAWNETSEDSPRDRVAHQLFEAQAERTPDELAVMCGDERLTYSELNRRANQLAHYLRALGVGPETRVAVCLPRSPSMIEAVLGIFKAGGSYVPLDPSYPAQRLAYMMENARPSVLLTVRESSDVLPAHGARRLYLDESRAEIARQPSGNLPHTLSGESPAYVIYTSGSTGRPKGVIVRHGGLCNMSDAQVRCFGVKPGDRVLQFASLSFDASIFEIMMGLRAGAALCLPTPEESLPGPGLLSLLQARRVTNVTLPPTALAALPEAELPSLRTIIVAGEACAPELVERWAGGREFFNAYGPTETTVWVTVARCLGGERKPLIGRPVSNFQTFLLDARMGPVPVGVAGELYVGGEGLARGYLGRPGLTAERFVPNPFSERGGARLYRTGDLARHLPDGQIDFLGRTDQQVKIRGFRIEPGEVEAELAAHERLSGAVVMAREDVPGQPRLVAYVVPHAGQSVTVSELRAVLKEKLPDFMIPSAFILLDRMPLTPNGKVDRKALPAPDGARPLLESVYVPPQTGMEMMISDAWCKALRLERVGVHDNFFDLGGHSLLMLRVQGLLHEGLKRELPLIALFKYPTVATLAAHLLSRETQAEGGEAASHRQRQQTLERAGRQRAAVRRQQRLVPRQRTEA